MDEFDTERDKHSGKKDSRKDKCIYRTDILSATKMSDNTHDESIPFEDSYHDYDDDSANVTVTENSDRDNINFKGSLSNLKDIKLENINHIIKAQLKMWCFA